MEIPEVTDLDVAFPAERAMELLPAWDDLTEAERDNKGPYCEAASSIFFNGGRLSDFGLTPKPGVDPDKLHRMLRVCLGSFAPSHEHKIGGVGHLLAKYCDLNAES